MSFFKGGMELPNSGRGVLPEEQEAVLDKFARWVVRRGLTVPAIMALESVKPLNYMFSQGLVFAEPMFQAVFNWSEYEALRTALERRECVEIVLLLIEEYDAVEVKRQKAFKKWYKKEKKNWKWYQRYLGIFTPKLEVPEEIKDLPAVEPKSATTDGDKPADDSKDKSDE